MAQKDKGVTIFGRFFSNKELFWNGFTFLLIGVFYEVISIGRQLPSDWRENIDAVDGIEREWLMPAFFFVVSYLLFDRRFFGENLQEIIDKFGYNGYFLRKFCLIIGLIFINSILKSIMLLTLF